MMPSKAALFKTVSDFFKFEELEFLPQVLDIKAHFSPTIYIFSIQICYLLDVEYISEIQV